MNLKKMTKEPGIVLFIIMFLALFLFIGIGTSAENIKIGTVTNLYDDDTLNFRSGPGTEYEVITFLRNGESGRILEEAQAAGGGLWYKLQINGLTGWASASYIEVTEQTVTEDKEFESYLIAQGFPESYRTALLALHNKYPNWKFEAQITKLDWNDVIAEESILGKNLTYTTNPSSWKSVQTGAYDWTSSSWIGFDSSEWVAASSEIIQYYMDPRNFLDENYIFQFFRQSYDENDTTYRENLTRMVQSTFLAGSFQENGVTKTYVDTILEAAKAGVSPYTLATMIIQEQGSDGRGGSITGTEPGYVGYYNFFNVGAYAVDGLTPVQKGLQYASMSGSYGRPWDTRTKSIEGGAEYFGQGYIQKGQDTIYLKKYNVQGDNLYSHQYMTNVQGAASEGRILSGAYGAEAREAALVFKIPVYNNMPAKACSKPTGNASPNYMLQSLGVTGQTMTPTFSMYDTSYSVIVEYDVSSIIVSAKAYDSQAVVTGTGTKKLAEGENKVDIVVTAQNGAVRTYSITIMRKQAPEEILPPTVSSSKYTIDSTAGTITGIKSFPVSASEFANNFRVSNGTLQIKKADGTAQTGNVGTGSLVQIYNMAGKLTKTYQVILYGDANGDGRVNAQDLLIIQKNNIRISILEGVLYEAADVNRDDKVNARDLLAVQKHNIRVQEIQQ